MTRSVVGSTVLAVGLAAAPVFAQGVAPAAPMSEQMQARYQIAVMESVLERAVEHGAQRLGAMVRISAMPDMFLLSGAAQARGFRLDGYGVFFDVQVPALRQSVAWSLRTMLDQNTMQLTTALQQLRQAIEKEPDKARRQSYEQALKRVELQVAPMTPPEGQPSGPGAVTASSTGGRVPGMKGDVNAPAAAAASPMVDLPPSMADPGEAYTSEVKEALIDAMLDYTGALKIGADEWLTVAARDNEPRLNPGDLYDTSTIVLRIKGGDLAAFRADRITRDDARKRVEVREF